MRRIQLWPMIFLIVGGLVFFLAQVRMQTKQRLLVTAEIQVALPVFVQVLLAGGDRYLAANWAAIRALVTETVRMKPDEFEILGKVQRDAAWMNPAHEDNYYIAEAILPWEGQVDAAQAVLRRAAAARFYDYQPAFFFAFNLFHFMGDSLAASEWLRQSAPRLSNPQESMALEDLAARWLDRSQNLDMAAQIVEDMAANTKRKDFAAYLHKRSQRLRDLALLRRVASVYQQRIGHPPRKLQDLVVSGLIREIPADPFGLGYGINAEGIPVFLHKPSQ